MILRVPRIVTDFGRVIDQAGYESYLVGGAVRNLLQGEKPADYDIACNAYPDEVKRIFRRVIPTGIRHGTVTVLFRQTKFEVTTYRTESTYSDSRRPDAVTFVPTLNEDLCRRDFAINAIAVDTLTGRITDPHCGREDLKNGIIRAIGTPEERFNEDGLRLLRACRFASQLGFSIENETLKGMIACRENITSVSVERIREEIDKILLSRRPSIGFLTIEQAQLLDIVLPELAACRGVMQYGNHAFDVFEHSLFSCDGAPASLEVRLAALFHDLGKPVCRKELSDGVIVFHRHEELSAELAGGVLRRLKYPKATERTVTHLIRNHMFSYGPEWTDAAARRFLRRVGKDQIENLFSLRMADVYGMRGVPGTGEGISQLRSRIASIVKNEEALSLKDLAIDGHDLAAAGIPNGPRMGVVLDFLLEAVMDDPSQNDRDVLIDLAVSFFNEHLAGK